MAGKEGDFQVVLLLVKCFRCFHPQKSHPRVTQVSACPRLLARRWSTSFSGELLLLKCLRRGERGLFLLGTSPQLPSPNPPAPTGHAAPQVLYSHWSHCFGEETGRKQDGSPRLGIEQRSASARLVSPLTHVLSTVRGLPFSSLRLQRGLAAS